MDLITPAQLQKYQGILDEIDSECVKCELFKRKLQSETDKLITARIVLEEKLAKESVFRVIVKVFLSIFEIFYLYKDDITHVEFESLRRECDCKFYLVELYISKLFQQKIVNHDWLLNVCIKSRKRCVNKSMIVNKEQIKDRILIVVPFDASSESSTVDTNLLIYFEDFCSVLRISTIDVDVSYHFSAEKAASRLSSPVVELALNYKPNLELNLWELPLVKYLFQCKCSAKHLFESVVKNCYHRLNMGVFIAFSGENTDVVTVHFAVDGEGGEATFELNKIESRLSVSCHAHDLDRIKNYFIEEIRCQRVIVDKGWLMTLMKTKSGIQTELGQTRLDPNHLHALHKDLRRLIFDLPV